MEKRNTFNIFSVTKRLIILCILVLPFMIFNLKEGYCEQKNTVESPTMKTLRVAILDNPNLPEKASMWFDYEQAYLAGIEMAKVAAKKQDILLEYKPFFYGNKPLDVLKQIPNVKAWRPDFILGPHYSNQFLLLKKYFPDVVVLSAYASDPELADLPSNFYSIFPPDDTLIKSLSEFMNVQFANKNIFMILQADCKNCNDMAELLKANYKRLNNKVKITETSFIGNKIEDVNIARVTKGYQEGDIIFLEPENYYSYMNLMPRIVAFLKKSNVAFFTALDAWGGSDATQKFLGPVPFENYEGYRITSLLLDDTTDMHLKEFKKLFFEHYKKMPKNPVSYMTFLAMMSVTTALEKFPEKNQNLTMQVQVLKSFEKARYQHPNWFRPKQYGIYRYSDNSAKQGEVLIKTVPAFGS